MTFELRPITSDNLGAVLKVRVADGQRRFVADVADSLAQAYVAPEVAWPRAVVDGDQVVGFVMGGFDDAPGDWWDGPLHAVWRLNVDAAHQGRGVGRFAVEQLAAEAVVEASTA
jgi:diamine N-acetyltransferase